MRSHLPAYRRAFKLLGTLGLLMMAASCSFSQAQIPPRKIPVQQKWTLQPGGKIGDFDVVGGLGDVSIRLDGSRLRAPFDGTLQPTEHHCVAFSSPEIPAYLFRMCGIKRPRLGEVEAGQVIGHSEVLQFAAMRRQPDGTWAIVEPATDILEKLLPE